MNGRHTTLAKAERLVVRSGLPRPDRRAVIDMLRRNASTAAGCDLAEPGYPPVLRSFAWFAVESLRGGSPRQVIVGALDWFFATWRGGPLTA